MIMKDIKKIKNYINISISDTLYYWKWCVQFFNITVSKIVFTCNQFK